LCLDNVGMIAADTSRSRAYIQAMSRNKLLPKFVLLMMAEGEVSLPGQLSSISDEINSDEVRKDKNDCWSEIDFNPSASLVDLLNAADVQYEVIEEKSINSQLVIDALNKRKESTFVFSGFGGEILRSQVLNCGKRFLHVHGGYLPNYKGSTTNYYSIINENLMGASSLFINENIDCGPVLQRRKFAAPKDRVNIDHIYDSAARAKVLIETLKNYVSTGGWNFELENNDGGETYYIIHPVLKHIAILKDL